MVAHTNLEMVLEMLFLALSNANFQLGAKELTWRTYIVAKTLPTTSRVELIDKREFAKVALDENLETFVVHVSALNVAEPMIYPSRATQIAAL